MTRYNMEGDTIFTALLLLLVMFRVSQCGLSTELEEEEKYIKKIMDFDFGNSDDNGMDEIVSDGGSVGSCDGNVCDAGRYNQIRSSLCGYNAFLGEPYSVVDGVMDQGIRHQIFEPGTKDAQGKISLKGITAVDQKLCATTLNSRVFTNSNNFSKAINKISGLGFGIDMEVFKVGIGATFSHSNTKDEINAFFSEDHGVISIAYMQCITAKIFVDYFDLPKFKNGFRRAVYFLGRASKESEARQKYFFRRFINEYGTHYMTGTEMGATIMETRFLTRKARKSYSREHINKCTKFGAKIKYEKAGSAKMNASVDWKDCKDFQDSSNSTRRSLVKKETYVVKGCSPPKGDIQQWASQTFTPMPLRFELSPISNLLSEEVLEDQEIKGIDVAALRKWFIPMLGRYCEIMGIDCHLRGGCGFSDNCKLEEDCMVIDPKKETYKCVVDGHWGEWSSWSQCSTKCGKGNQRRSRQCNKPSPAKGGRPCPGKSVEVQTCDMGSCDGQVFEHECKWVPGGNGKQAACPHGYIATGACGSGALSDCDHQGTIYTTKLKCCRTSAAVTNYCSLKRSRESGVKIDCPSQRVVTSICGSEMYRECWAGDNWAYYFTDCCAMKDHRPGFERDCYWRFETYGKDLECGKNMIMTGMCGVGHATTERCPRNTHHGIKCCTFSKRK